MAPLKVEQHGNKKVGINVSAITVNGASKILASSCPSDSGEP